MDTAQPAAEPQVRPIGLPLQFDNVLRFDIRVTLKSTERQKEKGICSNCNRIVDSGASQCPHCGKKFTRHTELSPKLNNPDKSTE